MNTESLPDEAEPAASAEPELRGPVLDVRRTLIGDHQERDAVLSIGSELVACNTDLERRFARRGARYKPSEQVFGLVASILVEMYLDGLPLHRQRDRDRRLGLDIAVSTLADQVTWCTDLLQPISSASSTFVAPTIAPGSAARGECRRRGAGLAHAHTRPGELMFDHVKFGVSDYAASKAFFLKALEPLGVTVVTEWPPDGVELSQPEGNASLCLYQTKEKPAHLHLAFEAANRQQVEAFYRAALEAGGKDNGAPGLRPQYQGNYYAAFVIGPDGHNIEAVCHEPEA